MKNYSVADLVVTWTLSAREMQPHHAHQQLPAHCLRTIYTYMASGGLVAPDARYVGVELLAHVWRVLMFG